MIITLLCSASLCGFQVQIQVPTEFLSPTVYYLHASVGMYMQTHILNTQFLSDVPGPLRSTACRCSKVGAHQAFSINTHKSLYKASLISFRSHCLPWLFSLAFLDSYKAQFTDLIAKCGPCMFQALCSVLIGTKMRTGFSP